MTKEIKINGMVFVVEEVTTTLRTVTLKSNPKFFAEIGTHDTRFSTSNLSSVNEQSLVNQLDALTEKCNKMADYVDAGNALYDATVQARDEWASEEDEEDE